MSIVTTYPEYSFLDIYLKYKFPYYIEFYNDETWCLYKRNFLIDYEYFLIEKSKMDNIEFFKKHGIIEGHPFKLGEGKLSNYNYDMNNKPFLQFMVNALNQYNSKSNKQIENFF